MSKTDRHTGAVTMYACPSPEEQYPPPVIPGYPSMPFLPLTEERIRQIIREEIGKIEKEKQKEDKDDPGE